MRRARSLQVAIGMSARVRLTLITLRLTFRFARVVAIARHAAYFIP